MWDCMSFKEQGDIAIITSTINEPLYIGILDNFQILSVKNWIGNDEGILGDDNAS